MSASKKRILTRHERLLLAVTARCDERSIQKAYANKVMRSVTWTRIAEAAEQLKFPTPPALKT